MEWVYVNLTPHTIVLNDGRIYPASGELVRVEDSYGPIVDDIAVLSVGQIVGLPEPEENVRYIGSRAIIDALNGTRADVVAPATGHPDTVRNEKGHIVSVPCFTHRVVDTTDDPWE